MENTEIVLESLRIMQWVMGIGFTAIFALLGLMWRSMEKLDEKLTDVDRRLCRMEGVISTKEFCGLKTSDYIKKAE